MNSRERILTALKQARPDRVPLAYSFIDQGIQEQIVGHPLNEYVPDLSLEPGVIVKPGEKYSYAVDYPIHPQTARVLGADAVGVRFPSPLFCETRCGRDGHAIEKVLLTSREALEQVWMPDVNDERLYQDADRFIREFRDEFAIFACIRLGISSTLLSMGYDYFSYALYDEPELLRDVVELYTKWMADMVVNLNELGFDFLWAFDDIASKNGPMFSPEIWETMFFPRAKQVTDRIECPWIYHSDGNLLPILDSMLGLGMSGLHPLEPGTMDLDKLKSQYGQRLCLVGNIDINYTLTEGTVEEVETEVRERIKQLAPGGGFIISDSNSIPYFCNADNVVAMARAVQKYGQYDQ